MSKATPTVARTPPRPSSMALRPRSVRTNGDGNRPRPLVHGDADQSPVVVGQYGRAVPRGNRFRTPIKVGRVPPQPRRASAASSTLVAMLQCVTDRRPTPRTFIGRAGRLFVPAHRSRLRTDHNDQRLHAHDHRRVRVDQERRDQRLAPRAPTTSGHWGAVVRSTLRFACKPLRSEKSLASFDKPIGIVLATCRCSPDQALIEPHRISMNTNRSADSLAGGGPRLLGMRVVERATVIGNRKGAPGQQEGQPDQHRNCKRCRPLRCRRKSSLLCWASGVLLLPPSHRWKSITCQPNRPDRGERATI